MHKYISDFLRTGLDNSNFINSTKTYFPPWWRFWDRKIKAERSYSNDLSREFDENGKVIRISRQRYTLHPSGFGSSSHTETLDVKTHIATSYPRPNMTRQIFSDGKCREIYDFSSGEQKVTLGRIDPQGNMDIYANLFFKNGKQMDCCWIKKVQNPEIWKEVLTEFPASLEGKAERLRRASQTFRQAHQPPQNEADLRAYKDAEEVARFRENKKSSFDRLSKFHRKKFQKNYLPRVGGRRDSP